MQFLRICGIENLLETFLYGNFCAILLFALASPISCKKVVHICSENDMNSLWSWWIWVFSKKLIPVFTPPHGHCSKCHRFAFYNIICIAFPISSIIFEDIQQFDRFSIPMKDSNNPGAYPYIAIDKNNHWLRQVVSY